MYIAEFPRNQLIGLNRPTSGEIDKLAQIGLAIDQLIWPDNRPLGRKQLFF